MTGEFTSRASLKQSGIVFVLLYTVAELQRQLHLSSPLLLRLFLSLSTPTIHFLQFSSATESTHTFLKEIYHTNSSLHISFLYSHNDLQNHSEIIIIQFAETIVGNNGSFLMPLPF